MRCQSQHNITGFIAGVRSVAHTIINHRANSNTQREMKYINRAVRDLGNACLVDDRLFAESWTRPAPSLGEAIRSHFDSLSPVTMPQDFIANARRIASLTN